MKTWQKWTLGCLLGVTIPMFCVACGPMPQVTVEPYAPSQSQLATAQAKLAALQAQSPPGNVATDVSATLTAWATARPVPTNTPAPTSWVFAPGDGWTRTPENDQGEREAWAYYESDPDPELYALHSEGQLAVLIPITTDATLAGMKLMEVALAAGVPLDVIDGAAQKMQVSDYGLDIISGWGVALDPHYDLGALMVSFHSPDSAQ